MPNSWIRRPRKACEHCTKRYQPKQRYTQSRYCSRACGHAARSSEARVEAGRKGGRIRSERSRRRADQLVTVRLANFKQQAYRMGFSAGYTAGHTAAERERRTA